MKNNTAMKELIIRLGKLSTDANIKAIEFRDANMIYSMVSSEAMCLAYDEAIEQAKQLLEKERQQIVDAFNDASLDGDKFGGIYFSQTFKKD